VRIRLPKELWKCILPVIILLGFLTGSAWPGDSAYIRVTLQPPPGPLKMGDTPYFRGTVTNLGHVSAQGLIVYLSLVSLAPGHEQPVDLEDWSAQKAVRIARLDPGYTHSQNWNMRLIQAGKYGVALTVVDPRESRPVISDLVRFEVLPKPTLSRGRVLPVSIGMPLLILVLLGVFSYSRSRMKRSGT
jgi:hypothetical protein